MSVQTRRDLIRGIAARYDVDYNETKERALELIEQGGDPLFTSKLREALNDAVRFKAIRDMLRDW